MNIQILNLFREFISPNPVVITLENSNILARTTK